MKHSLRIAAFLPRSRANGPGLRSVLWLQGCPLRCAGCFNPDFLAFDGGREVAAAEVAGWMLAETDCEGVSFSGGEPFAQAEGLAEVAEGVRAVGKGVLIFTGFTAATLRASRNSGVQRLLAAADLLVAGPYRQELAQSHALLGSSNQELVFVSERYRGVELGLRRAEFRVGLDGAVTVTGFPGAPCPPPLPSPTEGEGVDALALGAARAARCLWGATSLPPLRGKARMGGASPMNTRLSGRARELRKAMTDAERRLWGRLRNEQLGARFRRQAPIGPYIADFVCFAQRLVIECDGGQHAEPVQAAHDGERTAFLEDAGFRVLRFWNNEVLGNLDGVVERITQVLAGGRSA